MDGVTLTPLNRIFHPNGDICHALKASESSFDKFGEAYFTTIHHGKVKGWKKHQLMSMNLIVPVGKVRFYIRNDKCENLSIELGDNNYQRLTIKSGLWVAFAGIGESINLVLNIANLEHDPNEAINIPLETYPL